MKLFLCYLYIRCTFGIMRDKFLTSSNDKTFTECAESVQTGSVLACYMGCLSWCLNPGPGLWDQATKECVCCGCLSPGITVDITNVNSVKVYTPEPCFRSYELFSYGSLMACLRHEVTPLPYIAALEHCRADGGDLIKIDSQGKNNFFKAFMSIHGDPSDDVWIQEKLLAGNCTWVFEDDTTNTYTSWGTGGAKCDFAQPRIRAKATSGYNWYDRSQGDLYTYLCEMDPAV